MRRLLLLKCFVFACLFSFSNTIVVKNIDELTNANKIAQPGDIVILQNGVWQNVIIKITCKGTKEKPITFKAATPGKVIISGHSQLKVGGDFIIIDGLLFKNGYAGNDAVISFRANKDQLANNCRVTNCAVDAFNNPKRMDENNWVLFYGKYNQLYRCSFIDKTNMGVLLAVILDDDRSRENFHSITHNYFGKRSPLASNGGEIIRVGLSQHCQFNSNTQIRNNFFEDCDGEAEIISIKSCSNVVESNIFKECQGSVVLRHGNNNIVSNNYFLGNDKPGSGGVRVINKGQEVKNNIFYKCRGTDFRSPLVIMNGVPNSPPTRYVQVTNAQITGNSFYECSPISLCEGSDAERTLPPSDVKFSNNKFYNTRDSLIYMVYDDIKGIHFSVNQVSEQISQQVTDGFTKTNLPKEDNFPKQVHMRKIENPVNNIPIAEYQTYSTSGASWFNKKGSDVTKNLLQINCANPEEIYKQLNKKKPVKINLTAEQYTFDKPLLISNSVEFTSQKKTINLSTTEMLSVFIISGKGHLKLTRFMIDGENIKASHFISSDTTGYSDHYNLSLTDCKITNLNKDKGCLDIFHAFKSMVADSVIIRNTQFTNNNCDLVNMNDEKEDKGYYSAEKIFIGHNKFLNHSGSLLNIYRGGSDESTLGPDVVFSHNKIENCSSTKNNVPLISLTGVQLTDIFSNAFINCNTGTTLILYKDIVRAKHSFERNILENSGKSEMNKFVIEKNNTIK